MNTLKQQFNDMLKRGVIPVFEYAITNDDYLIVNIDQVDKKGVYFSFDEMNLPVSFDGEIIKKGDSYLIKYDECFDHLDSYLEMISDNITEGFLLPNNLYVEQ